ncbi:MAG: hypothetical protein COW79_15490 [Bdellovibrionales bacterium CG22_combo_CG10-13_8_21_14_all_38_13]|nr:MAG: hypothetical protein COW79_15490 [Bdellovibrionales bacterium CG22_combo_CG10-13_8_21_14_all_38_13]
MLSCREAAEIVCDGKSLPPHKKPGLWFHLAICKACRLYSNQISSMKSLAKKMNYKNDLAEKKLEQKILEKFVKNVEKK